MGATRLNEAGVRAVAHDRTRASERGPMSE
jgi:hypothetical protein